MVRVVTTLVVVMVIFGAMPTFAAEGQSTEPQPKLQIVTPVVESRPAILPPLYLGLAVLQTYDGYTTIRGVRDGNPETNPLVGGLAGRPAVFWTIKAASTAVTIYAAEQLWRQHHRKQAIVTMLVANGLMAAVAARNASLLSSPR